MDFLDHSGHIFSLQSFSSEPIGYEYDETPYIFWINNTDNGQLLSVNNYYTKVINVLFKVNQDITNINVDDLLNIDIKVDSHIFSFIPANLLQTQVTSGDIESVYTSYFNINSSKLSKHLTNEFSINADENKKHEDDFVYIKIKEDEKTNYLLIPLYLIAYADEPGSWTSNILIHISYKTNTDGGDWCPVTVGGIFTEQYEEMTIHGQNMGVNLPPDILRAVNGVSFYGDSFDEEKYNEKLKEYLINFMGIKGERGNYNSAIQSIKWFGYNGLINISKLLQTDNIYKEQFVRDYFNIKYDIIEAFKYFLTTQLISLGISLNKETGENYKQFVDEILWGERLPILEDLTNKKTLKYTDELIYNQEYGYVTTYFKYSVTELGLKIAAMKYYLEKYFLPIFIKIKNFSLEYKVYQPDTKMICRANTIAFGGCYTTWDSVDDVTFEETDSYYYTHQKHYVDDILNVFVDNSNEEINEGEDKTYMVNDTCISIPIKFNYNNKAYNCTLFLYDENNKCIYESRFTFMQREDYKYSCFILYPKMIAKILGEKKIFNCINKNYKLCLLVNNSWYIKEFTVRISEFRLDVGTVNYQYYNNDINYLYYKYHEFDTNNGNNAKVLFNFKEAEQNEYNPLDITNFVKDYDFFDNPSKYVSYFKQIKSITDDKVLFNRYMFNSEFVNVNNLEFDIYDTSSLEFKNLIDSYRETVNIINDNKYLNHIILYDLYEETIDELSIPLFNDRFRVRSNGLEFIKENTSSEEIIINGTNTNEEIITKNGVDYYFIKNEDSNLNTNYPDGLLEYGLKEHDSYTFYLKRDDKYNIIPYSDTGEYSYYIDKDNVTEIGYVIFKDFESFAGYTNIEENNLSKEGLHQINGKYYIDEAIDNIGYSLSFVRKTATGFEDAEVTIRDWIYERSEICLKVKFYEYGSIKILNYAGYYGVNTDDIETSNLNLDTMTCTVTVKENDIVKYIIDDVPVISNKSYYYTVNGDDEDPAYIYNPSLWYAVDGDEDYEQIINKLNSIKDEWISENDDIQNHCGTYYNVLLHNLSGYSGEYALNVDNENVRLCIDITDENNIQRYYTTNGETTSDHFILTGKEKGASIYLYIPENTTFDNQTVKPKLIKYNKTYSKKQWNSSEDIVELYRDMFKEEFEITVENENVVKDKIEIWNSAIPFENNEFYDMYLMHDKEYWYIVQISKDTINNLMTDYKKYKDVQQELYYKNYLLKFIKYDSRFLINRMKYKSAEGINHFDKNELIIVNITNNRMLPNSIVTNTKWAIKPLSVGMHTKANIYGTTNMAIVSVPNNDNEYPSGYYEVNVNYSLTHRFANNQTLKTKILVV